MNFDPLYLVIPGIIACAGWLGYLGLDGAVRRFFGPGSGFRADP